MVDACLFGPLTLTQPLPGAFFQHVLSTFDTVTITTLFFYFFKQRLWYKFYNYHLSSQQGVGVYTARRPLQWLTLVATDFSTVLAGKGNKIVIIEIIKWRSFSSNTSLIKWQFSFVCCLPRWLSWRLAHVCVHVFVTDIDWYLDIITNWIW